MASGEAAKGELTPRGTDPNLDDLSLVPLARIASKLSARDIEALAKTCKSLAGMAAATAAAPMATPKTWLAKLPLVPLVRIARRLTCADVHKLAEEYPELAHLEADLMAHALPSKVGVKWPVAPRTAVEDALLSPDGAHVAILYRAHARLSPARLGVRVGPVDGGARPVAGCPNLDLMVDALEPAGAAPLFVLSAKDALGRVTTYFVDTDGCCRNGISWGADHVFSHYDNNATMRVTGTERGMALEVDGAPSIPLGPLQHPRGWGACFSPGSRLFAYVDDLLSVQAWETAHGRLLHMVTIPGAHGRGLHLAHSMRFTEDETRLIVYTASGHLHVWDMVTGALVLTSDAAVGRWARALAVRGGVALAASGTTYTKLVIINVETGASYVLARMPRTVATGVALTPGCTHAVLVENRGAVHTWELGGIVRRLARAKHM